MLCEELVLQDHQGFGPLGLLVWRSDEVLETYHSESNGIGSSPWLILHKESSAGDADDNDDQNELNNMHGGLVTWTKD